MFKNIICWGVYRNMILDKIELEMHGPSVNKSFFNKL